MDVSDVEIRFLPQLGRLQQRDGREAVPGARAPHRHAGSALSRLALGGGAKFEVEALPPEFEGGESAEISFTHGDEGGQQHHRIWREVVRLDLVEIKERAEEVARWKAEAAKEMRPEDDAFVVLRRR
jgi:hypothetical protein